ncbi:MAG: integrating conjugative element protein [Steroidobacteraceae bacterium]
MMNGHRLGLLLSLSVAALPAFAGGHRLIVVKDLGGVSALPYYRALNLLPSRHDEKLVPLPPSPAVAPIRYNEADFLPVHARRLTPGHVTRRVIAAPGLAPFCLIGDDPRSLTWLKERLATLQQLHAVGLVVQVASEADLKALRRSAPGVLLVPASGDDIARRLDLHHYPVLITATGIEQ